AAAAAAAYSRGTLWRLQGCAPRLYAETQRLRDDEERLQRFLLCGEQATKDPQPSPATVWWRGRFNEYGGLAQVSDTCCSNGASLRRQHYHFQLQHSLSFVGVLDTAPLDRGRTRLRGFVDETFLNQGLLAQRMATSAALLTRHLETCIILQDIQDRHSQASRSHVRFLKVSTSLTTLNPFGECSWDGASASCGDCMPRPILRNPISIQSSNME
ncbi:hypothetical protein IWX49DRAFT_575994, partial [Phyllosticta citricarpa]